MGFEIPIDTSFFRHPKAKRMIAILGKRADVFPLRLWAWAADFAKEGKIDGDAAHIESVVEWDGKPGLLHAAFIECEILDPDGVTIHDWMDHAGRKVCAYERKKMAQRRSYSKKADPPPEQILPLSAGILPEEKGILPAESGKNSRGNGNSSNLDFPAGGNSSNPAFINETKRNETETKRNETQTERILAMASKAAFDEGWGNDPKRMAIWNTQLSDLFVQGLTIERLEGEMAAKLKGESPWDFAKRLLAGKKKPERSGDLGDDFRKRAGVGAK